MPTMPLPNVTTADQLLVLRDPGWRHELWRGELRRMSFWGQEHGAVSARVGAAIANYVRIRRLGCAFAAGTGFLLARDPDTVLAADVAFVRSERMPPKGGPGFFPGPPDLAVEVFAPDESRHRVASMVAAWLAHGTNEAWVVDTEHRTLAVHRNDEATRTFGQDATLRDSTVLPGFTLVLAELFDD